LHDAVQGYSSDHAVRDSSPWFLDFVAYGLLV
jgi:hypothetical protein